MEKIRAMAVVHAAEFLDIIVDGGESAKNLNRPGMARLLALVDRERSRPAVRAVRKAGPIPSHDRKGVVAPARLLLNRGCDGVRDEPQEMAVVHR
jgi:hypothetical protein